jgi:hypothetical protein
VLLLLSFRVWLFFCETVYLQRVCVSGKGVREEETKKGKQKRQLKSVSLGYYILISS